MNTATEQRTGLRGKELLRAVVNQILDHPETWDQEVFHCQTTHCVAGWCQILGGRPEDSDVCVDDATELLGIDAEEADYLFDSFRTLPQIYAFAVDFIGDGPIESLPRL